MLLGQYASVLTAKGRIALPAKFRKEIGETAIIAKWYEGCLVIVDIEGWLVLLNRLSGRKETFTKPVRDTDRFILGSAYEITTDNQGRFVIPKPLRDYAKIGNEAIFLGLGDRVEVWDKNAWRKEETRIQMSSAQTIEKIAQLKKGKE